MTLYRAELVSWCLLQGSSRWARAELAMFENNPDLLEDRLENIWKIDSNIANVREVV
jgi:hypothetical protein